MNDADRLRAQKRASTDPERLERMAQEEEGRMTDDEREARKWLQKYIKGGWQYPATNTDDMLRTILALLDAPRLPRPEEVPEWVLEEMRVKMHDNGNSRLGMMRALQVHYDYYTVPPKPEGPWGIKAADGTLEGVFIQRSDAERYIQKASGSRIVKLVEDRDGE